MKKHKMHFEGSTKDQTEVSFKKQKTIPLSEAQKIVADKDILYFLDKGDKDTFKFTLSLMFNTPKKVETLLTYTNYKIFWWAIEHEDFELMQYVVDKTTERGKFLIVCHNDYELIKKFVDLNIERIKEGTYQALATVKTLKILLDANLSKSHLITEAVKNFVNALDEVKAVKVLKLDLQGIIIEFTGSESSDYNPYEELYSICASNNTKVEQELGGELPHTADSL